MQKRKLNKFKSCIFTFPKVIFPVVVSYSRHTRFAIVDFPLPVFPNTPSVVPSFIVKLMLLSATIFVSLYFKLTPLKVISPVIGVSALLVFSISDFSSKKSLILSCDQ